MAMEPRERRHRGGQAEAWVAGRLVEAGWRVLDRNFTVRGGELDLVIEREGVRAFVEVRSRSRDDHGSAAATVGPKKRHRVRLAARHWLARHGDGGCDLRFDVIAVELEDGRATRFDHLEAAFF